MSGTGTSSPAEARWERRNLWQARTYNFHPFVHMWASAVLNSARNRC